MKMFVLITSLVVLDMMVILGLVKMMGPGVALTCV